MLRDQGSSLETMSREPRNGGRVFEELGECFKDILKETRKEVKYALERWDNTYKLQIKRAEKKRTRVVNAKTELYQLISLYILFQGVVLTTVAHTNLTCRNSFAPAAFSLLVSVAAIFGLRDRLIFYYDTKSALNAEEAKANVTSRKINYVLSEGERFQFRNMDNECWLSQDPIYSEDSPLLPDDSENRELSDFSARVRIRGPTQFKRDPEKHYWHVMGFLILFSALVFINCFTILCRK